MKLRYRITFFVLPALLLFPGAVFSQTENELHKKIESLLQEQKISGAVWSTVSPDGTISIDSAGLKSIIKNEKLLPTDKVHVGSVSKTLIALGVLRLATEGKLDLDDPVIKYLPGIPLDNPWESSNPVTIRHLLDHTSGLTDLRLWHLFSTSSTPDTPLSAFFEPNHDVLSVKEVPGSVFSYSNIGYTLAGMVIESVTNDRYEDYLYQNLLRPIGMTDSTFRFVSQTGEFADERLAMGHLDNDEEYLALPMYLRPAGQFTTTAYDMGIFLQFLMGDGTLEEEVFIDQKYLVTLGKPTTTIALKKGLPYGYGLGTSYRDRHNVVGLARSGTIIGYRAMFYAFPEQKKAFFIAHNMDSETADYEVFNKALIEYLKIPTRQSTLKEVDVKPLQDFKGYYIPVITKTEPFWLLDVIGSFTKVSIKDTTAELRPFQKEPITLYYAGDGLFRVSDRVEVSHSFYKNNAGELFITNGQATLMQTSPLLIIAIVSSLVFGILAILSVLLLSVYKLVKLRMIFFKDPISWVFVPVTILVLAGILISRQSFIQMGDMTTGNILLAFATGLLPITTGASLVAYLLKEKYFAKSINFWVLISLLQFCILLIFNGLMPLIMWK